jgi:hypothetical protein
VGTHPSLTFLCLSRNGLGDAGVRALADALARDGGVASPLASLELAAVGVGRPGLRALEALAAACLRLVRLELAGNGAAFNEAVRLERALALPGRRAAMLARL